MEHPKHLLQQHGLSPKKSLGQNFIFDDFILTKIVDAADLSPEDHVLEIGPGLGALTCHLAERAGKIVAVEVDGRLVPIFMEQIHGYTNIELVEADILDINPVDYFPENYKVVANVPYYITGAILRHLLSGEPKPSVMVMTVQQEVAERLTADPGNLSLMAISVQFYGQVEIVEKIKAGAFWPRPDVDSAVIRITLYSERAVSQAEEKAFFGLVRAGFSQKRKQLQKNLRAIIGNKQKVRQLLDEAGIDGTRRAETLDVQEWAAVFRQFYPPK